MPEEIRELVGRLVKGTSCRWALRDDGTGLAQHVGDMRAMRACRGRNPPTEEGREGLLHELVTVRLGHLDGGCGHDCLVLDGGQPAECVLAATAG